MNQRAEAHPAQHGARRRRVRRSEEGVGRRQAVASSSGRPERRQALASRPELQRFLPANERLSFPCSPNNGRPSGPSISESAWPILTPARKTSSYPPVNADCSRQRRRVTSPARAMPATCWCWAPASASRWRWQAPASAATWCSCCGTRCTSIKNLSLSMSSS